MAKTTFNPADPVGTNPLQKEIIGVVNLVDETKSVSQYVNDIDDSKNTIEFSAGYDNQHPMMEDFVPESLIKIYPYRAIKGEAKDFILQPNQITIIRVGQEQVDDFKNLKTDANGKKYFEILAAIDNTTKVALSSVPEEMVQTIRKLKTFTAVTTNYFDTRDDLPDFFTIDKAFNASEYKKGAQIVYFGSNFTPAYPEDMNGLVDDYLIEDESKLAEIVLTDISQLEEQFSKSKIYITTDTNLLQNPTITYRDEDTKQNVTKYGFRLTTNPYSLINSVKAKGKIEIDNFELQSSDIDLISPQSFMPIKMSPDKVTDKVIFHADWFDYNNSMPYFVADYFNLNDGATLKDLIMLGNVNESYRYLITFNEMSYSSSMNKNITLTENQKEGNTLWELIDLDKTSTVFIWNSLQNGGFGVFNLPENFNFNNFVKTKIDNITYYYLYNGQITLTDKVNNKNIVINNLKFSFFEDKLTTSFDIVSASGLPDSDNIKLTISLAPYFKATGYSELLKKEDITLIEDMIIVSAGFKDSWNKAPRDKDHPDKISPEYRIGHRGALISSIADKKPADVIDGFVLQHEDLHPSFRTNKQRYLAFRFIVNALSKYIFSNTYTTNSGANELIAITQPWFLINESNDDTGSKIDYWKTKAYVFVDDMAEEPVGENPPGTEKKDTRLRKSYILSGVSYDSKGILTSLSNIKFKTYSCFFKDNFSQKDEYGFENGIKLPKNINMTSLKIAESDRKVILPELKDNIVENNKINIPGQNNGSEDYLSNYFLIPASNINDLKRFYLDGKSSKNSFKSGDTLTYNLERGNDGVYWDKEMVKEKIYSIFGRNNIEPLSDDNITINMVESFEETVYGSYVNSPSNPNDGRWTSRNREFWWGNLNSLPRTGEDGSFLPGEYTEQRVIENFGYDKRMFDWSKMYDFSYVNWESGRGLQGHERYLYTRGYLVLSVKHAEFSPIKIKFIKDLSTNVSKVSLEKRLTYFDKTEWMKYINAYLTPINNDSKIILTSEDNTKINTIEEITLLSAWGDRIKIYCDGMQDDLIFDLPSKEDETIGVQRITIV